MQVMLCKYAAGEALANVQLPGIKAHADPVEVVGQPGSPTSEGGSPKNKEGKRGRPPGAFGKGRGRGRGRGRPPNLGTVYRLHLIRI